MKRYGPLVILLVAVPLLAFGPTERVAPTHWALIVGISDYTHFGDEAGGDLPGAVDDARRVRDVLVERWEFPEENIRMLLKMFYPDPKLFRNWWIFRHHIHCHDH